MNGSFGLRMQMKHNKIVETRYCTECKKKAAVLWYTRRGRMQVMCLQCGKVWNCYDENCPTKD